MGITPIYSRFEKSLVTANLGSFMVTPELQSKLPTQGGTEKLLTAYLGKKFTDHETAKVCSFKSKLLYIELSTLFGYAKLTLDQKSSVQLPWFAVLRMGSSKLIR